MLIEKNEVGTWKWSDPSDTPPSSRVERGSEISKLSISEQGLPSSIPRVNRAQLEWSPFLFMSFAKPNLLYRAASPLGLHMNCWTTRCSVDTAKRQNKILNPSRAVAGLLLSP